MHGVEVVAEESAVDDSEGHGLAEHAIREMQAKIRTLKKQAEELHKGELGVDHLNYRWWVELAATSVDIGRRRGQMARLRGNCAMAVKREFVEGSGKSMVSLWWQGDGPRSGSMRWKCASRLSLMQESGQSSRRG